MKKTLKLLGLLFLLSNAQAVFSHGTVIYPASRIYKCFKNPAPAVCGPCGNAIYDWMSVLQPDTDFGNHEAFVPDGLIASGASGGGMDFSCLDALTTDWPTTTVNHGNIDVLWENKAPHKTEYYKVYITPLDWNPTKPLKWGELIEIGQAGKSPAEPFSTITSFIPDTYIGKRAALVSVWQRDYTESHEAFYAVSDILVAGDTGCTIGDSVNATFANNTNCNLEYYQNNTLQGVANVGSSYNANTTVGSIWEARDVSGSHIDSLTIACGQSTYTTTGQCEGNSCADGDSVSISFVNSTDCTLEYYLNNTLQGFANIGSSYVANTTIGSHWDVRNSSGERISHFHIKCDQSTYTSSGNCNIGGDCNGLDLWSASATYVAGNKVAYNGVEYEAKWWNQEQNPEQNSGPYQVWENLGTCFGGGCDTGDTVNITFANNSNCTLEYYLNNTLQGAANAGSSFAINTTVGSHWEARETSGEILSHFHIMCDQSTYTSTGSCNAGGCTPGDTVSVSFTNNTDCTLEYYQNNTLQGTAVTGSTFNTSAIIGNQWEARQATGELLSNFTVTCDQLTYISTGSCNTNTECAPAYGPYPNVYMDGDIVSYNGHKYECLVNNLFNVTPGTAAHWWKDLGSCSTNSNTRFKNLKDPLQDLNFVVFPNPAKDIINLEIFKPQSLSYTITIRGIDGRTLNTIILKASEGSARINRIIKLNKLSSGIYFVNVTSGNQTMTQKFIVK